MGRDDASDEAHKRHSPVPALIPGGIPDAAGEVKFTAIPKKAGDRFLIGPCDASKWVTRMGWFQIRGNGG
jgi:hypothetical protein